MPKIHSAADLRIAARRRLLELLGEPDGSAGDNLRIVVQRALAKVLKSRRIIARRRLHRPTI